MKAALLLLLLSIPMCGQDAHNPKVIPFNRADTEHCKVTKTADREMLETSYGGTSVAISLPTGNSDGEFQMYVEVRQVGPGSVEVKPQDFGAYYSDPAHTRFPWYDEAARLELEAAPTRARGNSKIAGTGDTTVPGTPPPPGSLNSNAYTGETRTMTGQDPNAAARQQEERRQQQGKLAQLNQAAAQGKPEILAAGVILEGTAAEGLVFFRKPKGFKVKSGQPGVLYQIDIPVNGVIFRFR